MSDDLDFSLDISVSGEELLGGTDQMGRVAWLSQRIRRDDFFLLQDGSFSKLLFGELLECFVNGQFIATAILGFSLIERTIAGRLSHIGERAEGKSSRQLLRSALDRKWITQLEFDSLDKLRNVRNPLVHFKDHLAPNRPEVKAVVSGRDTAQLLEADAKRILEATIHVLGKTAL